jgi:hypothetical protein
MWIRLACQCRIGMVDEILVRVEQRADSVGHQRVKMSEDIIKLYQSLDRYVPDLSAGVTGHIRRFLAREHTALGWEYRTKGDRAAARQHYWAAMRQEFKPVALLRWLRACLPGGRPLRRKMVGANSEL